MGNRKLEQHAQELAAEVDALRAEVARLTRESAAQRQMLALVRDNIRRAARDTLWADDHTTVVDAIGFVLGDEKEGSDG